MNVIFSWHCRGLERLKALLLAIEQRQQGERSTA